MPEDIHWRKYMSRFRTFPKRIGKEVNLEVDIIICIPVIAEPDVISTLNSLLECQHPGIRVEVILLFNKNIMMSEDDIAVHQKSWNECLKWINQNSKDEISFLPVYVEELPDPAGGVGWARKLAMDEAARRLDGRGLIICLDGDCLVSSNYITAIYQHFQEFSTCNAASVFVEHSLNKLNPPQREAIIHYELHLRYLIHGQKWCGHPFAVSTIGSAMIVRRKAYLEQGGMKTRQAGEDFYFLQKFVEVGGYMDIRNTTVYPSSRISSRVPFGTGKAMQQILEEGEEWVTTDFEIFIAIQPLFQALDKLRAISLHAPEETGFEKIKNELELSDPVMAYLKEIEFLEACHAVALQTTSPASFRKRFFRFFNAFRMIKYMHFMRDHYFPDVPVLESVGKLVNSRSWPTLKTGFSAYDYLKLLRKIDRENL